MADMRLQVMFMAFGGLPQLAVTLQNRNTWFKHRGAKLHTASSYAWSAALVQVRCKCPLFVANCVLPLLSRVPC